jgi:hypothetical protein
MTVAHHYLLIVTQDIHYYSQLLYPDAIPHAITLVLSVIDVICLTVVVMSYDLYLSFVLFWFLTCSFCSSFPSYSPSHCLSLLFYKGASYSYCR